MDGDLADLQASAEQLFFTRKEKKPTNHAQVTRFSRVSVLKSTVRKNVTMRSRENKLPPKIEKCGKIGWNINESCFFLKDENMHMKIKV